MARLINQTAAQRPAVIVIDILYSERTNAEILITRERFERLQPFLYHVLSGATLEIQTRFSTKMIGPGDPVFDQIALGSGASRAQDLALADAVERAVNSGIPVVLAAHYISDGGVAGLVQPYQELETASGSSIGLVGVRPDTDGMIRRYLPYGRNKEGKFVYGLALVAVAESKGLALPEMPGAGGDVLLGEDSFVTVVDGQFLVNFRGPPGTQTTLTAWEVLKRSRKPTSQLNGKIVFIGVTDPSVEDVLPTPFSGTDRMAGVEFHAAAADTLLRGSFIKTPQTHHLVLMVIALGLGALFLGRFVKPLLGFCGATVMLAALFGAWIAAFAWADYFLPLTALISGYAVSMVDRVGVEQFEKQQAKSMLSRYLSSGIVKEMLRNPGAARLGGQRADVTVLFSDIRGFTSISERLAPEEVVTLLNRYLTVMTEVIFRHWGTIDKFEGDGILAFFGAPQAHADDPLRAVLTALEMGDQLRQLESQWRDRTGTSLEIGVAINTGPVVVGNIGSPKRMEYTVIGDAVNVASRLQDLTKEHHVSILISGSTYARIKGMCRLRTIGRVAVRGRRQLVDLYEVEGLKADISTEAADVNSLVYAG